MADHKGDTLTTKHPREASGRIKMNWNSAIMFGLVRITERFSRLVGDVLHEVPKGETPKARSKPSAALDDCA